LPFLSCFTHCQRSLSSLPLSWNGGMGFMDSQGWDARIILGMVDRFRWWGYRMGAARSGGGGASAGGVEGCIFCSLPPHEARHLGSPLRRFLRFFGPWLHDVALHRVTHLMVFVTLCECYFGIGPHFNLWRWTFCLSLNKEGRVAQSCSPLLPVSR
jgi:hypothetical protein